MKYFFKDNSYNMFKMFVNQLGMTIFAITLSFPTAGNDTLFTFVSLFAIGFYMVLLYFMTWDIGNEEKIRIEGKRLKFVKLKGLYLSLGANIINFILATLMSIGYYSVTGFNENGAPDSPSWAVNLYGIPQLINRLLNAMFGGVMKYLPQTPLSNFITIIPALITCTVAYYMGVKGKRVFPPSKKESTKE